MGMVEIKSIGTLIDELITARLKLYLIGADEEPRADIDKAQVATLITELAGVSMSIFFALEKANKHGLEGDIINVGIEYGKAQKLNSRRSALIAAIDRRLGEGENAQMDKTF